MCEAALARAHVVMCARGGLGRQPCVPGQERPDDLRACLVLRRTFFGHCGVQVVLRMSKVAESGRDDVNFVGNSVVRLHRT